MVHIQAHGNTENGVAKFYPEDVEHQTAYQYAGYQTVSTLKEIIKGYKQQQKLSIVLNCCEQKLSDEDLNSINDLCKEKKIAVDLFYSEETVLNVENKCYYLPAPIPDPNDEIKVVNFNSDNSGDLKVTKTSWMDYVKREKLNPAPFKS
jgi:hypothetical protein